MRGSIGWMVALLLPGLAAGCARHAGHPSPATPPHATSQPRPPAGAASGLDIPEPGADGRFTTINSGIGGEEALWHVRSALNVAALACRGDAATLRYYNQFLTQRKAVLASAYASEAGHLGGAALDRHMTQLYNFFAQPPAQAAFCRAAAREAAHIVSVPAGDLPAYAGGAIGRLEAPILAFYRAYDGYRHDLAAWKAHPEAKRTRIAAAPSRPAPATEKAAGNWRIQIGAFTGKAAAKAAWERARARIPSLASYKPHYERVPGRKALVRVQLGSAADRAGALRLCAAAAAGGFDCIPATRR